MFTSLEQCEASVQGSAAGPNCIRKLLTASLLVSALTLSMPMVLKANMVSGRVYDSAGNPVRNQQFTVFAKGKCVKQFRTDRAGNYGVYLPPGRYSVGYPPRNGSCANVRSLGSIESYKQPVKQNIRLRR